MKRIRTAATALAAALLCLCTAACGSASEVVIETTPPAVIQPAKTKDSYITVGLSETFSYTDKTGNVYNAVYKIPKIDIDSEDAEAANEEINEKYLNDFASANNEVAAHNSLTCDSLDYDSYQDETILSVLIRRVYFSHTVDYSVYNFNVKTGKLLSNEELCEAIGTSYEKTMAMLQSKLKYDYAGKYATASRPKNYEEDLEKTMSEENLKASQFFLDSKGKLNAVCKEYTSVGTGEFSVVLSL